MDPGSKFFNLDESVECLCSVPSPIVVSKLLQISKRTRRLVWNFLIEPKKGHFDWITYFCEELSLFHPKRLKIRTTYYNLHPCFIPDINKLYGDTFHVCQALINTRDYGYTDLLVSLPTYINPEKKELFLHREIFKNSLMSDIFEWYIVACALNIRVDKIMLEENLSKKDGTIIVPHDGTLYITF